MEGSRMVSVQGSCPESVVGGCAGQTGNREIRFRQKPEVPEQRWSRAQRSEVTDLSAMKSIETVLKSRSLELPGGIRGEKELGLDPWDLPHLEAPDTGKSRAAWAGPPQTQTPGHVWIPSGQRRRGQMDSEQGTDGMEGTGTLQARFGWAERGSRAVPTGKLVEEGHWPQGSVDESV